MLSHIQGYEIAISYPGIWDSLGLRLDSDDMILKKYIPVWDWNILFSISLYRHIPVQDKTSLARYMAYEISITVRRMTGYDSIWLGRVFDRTWEFQTDTWCSCAFSIILYRHMTHIPVQDEISLAQCMTIYGGIWPGQCSQPAFMITMKMKLVSVCVVEYEFPALFDTWRDMAVYDGFSTEHENFILIHDAVV
jgi:hypothetical protein